MEKKKLAVVSSVDSFEAMQSPSKEILVTLHSLWYAYNGIKLEQFKFYVNENKRKHPKDLVLCLIGKEEFKNVIKCW